MDAKYGYDQDYDYEHGDDEFNAMVKDEMERLERQVRENVDQYDSGPYDSEDYNGHEATSNSVNSPRGRSGMANEEPTRLNSRGAAKPSGVNSIGSSEQTYAEKRAKQAQYVEQMRGDQYAEGPSRNRAPIRRPSHGIDSEPPSPYGVSAVGHTELTLAEKKAKQTQYLKQLQNDKQYSEVIPTPTRAPFQRREVDDISGPDLFSGMGRVESHNRNGRSQHTNASRQVDAAPDIFSGIGQGDARNRARSQNTNVAPRYVEEASPDIFSSMGQGDSRSRSHINGPRYDAESETTSNYSRQQDKPRSSNSQQQQPSSFMNQIGNSEMDTNGKRAQNKEYARLLADQRQQDELRKEQDDVMYGSSTSARSRSRSTPKGRSGTGVGAGSGVDYQSGGNASPFMPGSSASHDLISKQQRQQEYNRQLKEQQENKIQSDQLITGAGGRNSSFRRNDSTNNVNVNPNESDSGGLFSKLGGKDRPASAGRRRIVPANTNGNIIGQGFGMVDEASAKREQQEKYRKQLQNDAQGQVQGQGHIPSRSNSNNTNGNGNNYQSAHEINYDDESYGYGGSGDAAPSPRYSKQSEDYALGELIRQNSYKDNLPSGPSQGQGQGSGYGQGARSDSYGNYGRQQQQPLRQLGGGGGGKSSYAAASAIPSSSYGNANTNAPSSSLSNGYGTGLNIGGMDSVQDERAKKREQQLKYAQAIGQSAAMPAVDNRNGSGSGNRHGRDNYQMDQLTDQYRNPAAAAVASQQPRTDYRGRGNSSGGGTSGFRLG
eukprot:gene392-709_t